MKEKELIDGYCERVAGGYGHSLGEPFNTASNIAFIIAAIFLIKMLCRSSKIRLQDSDIIILITTLFAIGIGSALYHAIPTSTTLLMDVLPITLFIHLYIVSFLIRMAEVKWYSAVISITAFVGVGVFFTKTFDADTLNGTIMYVPAFLTLVIMAFILLLKKDNFAKSVFVTTAIWAISLSFRTFDVKLCDLTFGIGTHIFWHALNAVVLYRLVKILIEKKSR